jgi:hypothetical protein
LSLPQRSDSDIIVHVVRHLRASPGASRSPPTPEASDTGSRHALFTPGSRSRHDAFLR